MNVGIGYSRRARLTSRAPAMLAWLVAVLAMLGGAGFAAAEEDAGTLVFAAGSAQVDGAPAATGAVVHPGAVLKTGADGYIYLKTIDNGFLILRPGSEAVIVAYHTDKDQPANNRFKIELRQGVARSVSGSAVKSARQNFRFNTPVAAIGVRGTDFTVLTDDQTTRVAVASGGVIVSGFGAGCSAEGSGPCEVAGARELFAANNDYVLQVTRKQASPQLLRDPHLAPDTAVPPRQDEQSVVPKAASADPNLTPLKQARLGDAVAAGAQKPAAPTGPAGVLWGRWQPLIDKTPELDLDKLASTYQLAGADRYFALLSYRDRPFVAPQTGQVAFALQGSQAIVEAGGGVPVLAALENGRLQVDFGAGRFITGFDLVAQGQRYALQAQGGVSETGGFSNPSQLPGSNMVVNGVMANNADGSLTAGYLFTTRLIDGLSASGVTYWGR